MGGLNSKQIADIKKGKTDVLVITNQRKESLQKKLYTLSSTRTWNLSNNFLSALSPKISSLTLTSIDLSSNDFPSFPNELCKLATLTTLDLSYNFITDIPSDLQLLVSLTELNLSFNRITDLQDIGKITSLQSLKVTNNHITKIPDTFSKLLQIKHLWLSHNSITSLPKFTWQSLETFLISSNQLTQIPFAFLCPPNLRVISLSRNKLLSFPPNPIAGLNSNLREIHIGNNHLAELTTNIYYFPKLEVLDLKSNDLKEIPFELFVHSPLIHTLDLSFNTGCKWGMHMPNTFAPSPLVRDIHLSKSQCDEIGRSYFGSSVNSDSDNTDNESTSMLRSRKVPASPSHAALSPSPSSSPSSSPGSSPTSSPSTTRRPPFSSDIFSTTSSTTTITTGQTRMTTTTITADATDTQIIGSKSRRSLVGRSGPDEPKDFFKRKVNNKHVKKYVHNKKQFRLVEHDHTIWDQAVTSHAAHLAELLVWSGSPSTNVEEEIKKVLLQMTLIRPGLYLSSKYAAQDRATLHANGITHILVVGAELHPSFPSEFEYYSVSVRDNAIIDDLSIYFPICQKFIDTGRKKGGVLVHCAAGSSRSASCIMAYLMWKENLSFADARKELKTLRPIVKTNFYLQLEFYEGLLRGQTKRKPKTSPDAVEKEKPKLIRSTSLPTIDAVHAFKIESNREHESESEQDSESPKHTPKSTVSTPRLFSPKFFPFNGPRLPSRTESYVQSAKPTSDSQQARKLHRASRSLYSDLRVSPPQSEPIQPSLAVICEEGTNKVTVSAETTEKDKEIPDVGEGVPHTVIRQASDFEDLSEIHSLMRVHSLPELAIQDARLERKLSKGKSFLKHSKINLLEVVTEEEHT